MAQNLQNLIITQRGQKWEIEADVYEPQHGGQKTKDRKGANKLTFPDDFSRLPVAMQRDIVDSLAPLMLENL